MKIKNKVITKKDWFLKTLKKVLEDFFEDDFLKNKCRKCYEYDLDRKKNILIYDENHNIDLETMYYDECIEYFRCDFDFDDELSCIDGVGGSQDEQVGMIQFINCFSNLNLKINDFKIERDDKKIEINYIWEKKYIWKKHNYEFLSSFFNDFVDENAKKIFDEVLELNNKKVN